MDKNFHQELIDDLKKHEEVIKAIAVNMPIAAVSRNLTDAADSIHKAVKTLFQVERLTELSLEQLKTLPKGDEGL